MASKVILLHCLQEKMERPSILLALQKSWSASYSNTPHGILSGACWDPLLQSHEKYVGDGSLPTLVQMQPLVEGIECTELLVEVRCHQLPQSTVVVVVGHLDWFEMVGCVRWWWWQWCFLMQSNYMFILYCNFVSFQAILWYFYVICVYFHVGWKLGKNARNWSWDVSRRRQSRAKALQQEKSLNPCFLAATRIFLATAQKHGVDTTQSLEPNKKYRNEPLLR